MDKYIWDLTPLFTADDDLRIGEDMRMVEAQSSAYVAHWKERDDYLSHATVLQEALREYEGWSRSWGTEGNAGYYFFLRSQQDQNDPFLKAQLNKIEEFSRKILNDTQFFYLRLSTIPKELQSVLLNDEGLAPYRHFLERIFAEARHLLSEPEERIMNLKGAPAHSYWVRMTSSFLAKEEGMVADAGGARSLKSFSEVLSLMDSRDRKVRDSAATAFNAIMRRHVEVAEAELNAILGNKKTDDELRGFDRPDAARHLSDDVDSQTVDTLIESVAARFSIPAKYYALKAKLFGVKRLKYHERNVPYGIFDKPYPFDDAATLVEKVLGRLDGEFDDIFRRFVDNSQIDVYPRKGKANGAFCAHLLMTQPTYILLNHTDRLHDVLTLAHEVGHGINNELIRERQHALYFGTPLSTAEVASTFMEDFVLQEIIREAGDELRLVVMLRKLNDDVSTIFRQVACYRFERELHDDFRQKGYLSKDDIGAYFRRHMASYMGSSVEQSRGSENWWVYWSHIRSFFYVYSYASGLLISKSLQGAVKREPAFVSRVKEFLAAGLSDAPRNIFLRLGIDTADRTFWNRGLDEVEGLLEETTALAKRLGRL